MSKGSLCTCASDLNSTPCLSPQPEKQNLLLLSKLAIRIENDDRTWAQSESVALSRDLLSLLTPRLCGCRAVQCVQVCRKADTRRHCCKSRVSAVFRSSDQRKGCRKFESSREPGGWCPGRLFDRCCPSSSADRACSLRAGVGNDRRSC